MHFLFRDFCLYQTGNALKRTKSEMQKQQLNVSSSGAILKLLEEKSKYYDLGQTGNLKRDIPRARQSEWMSGRDLEHASDINTVGLNHRGSYNRSKYGQKAPAHEYATIGNPIEFGMDFVAPNPTHPTTNYPQHRRGSQHAVPREAYMIKPKERHDLPKLAVEVPQNIQHMFGSRICANLLSDKEKVQTTIEEQKEREAQVKRTRRHISEPTNLFVDPQLNPEYESIGNLLRQDIFPGMSTDHKISVHKTDFSQDVHKRRVACPDEYRYHRDQLSK